MEVTEELSGHFSTLTRDTESLALDGDGLGGEKQAVLRDTVMEHSRDKVLGVRKREASRVTAKFCVPR